MLHNSPSVSNFFRFIQHVLGVLMCVFVGLGIANSTLYTLFTVTGDSMSPTLKDGQSVLVSLFAYDLHLPERGDVVVVHYGTGSGIRLVKRIVALPGDRVSYQGKVRTLASGEYFLTGDNSASSADSRTFGPVRRFEIIGKAIIFERSGR